MIEVMDLKGSKGSTLSLYGVLDHGTHLSAYAYLLRAPKVERIPDPSFEEVVSFFRPTIPKPFRRGHVFHSGEDRFKCLMSLQVDKLVFFPMLMEELLILERLA